MTAIKRFVICVFAVAAMHAAGLPAALPADDAFSRPPISGTEPYVSDALPSPKPILIAPNAGPFGAADDGPADMAPVADARALYGPRVRHPLPRIGRRERGKPYLIPFETGPPAA